MAKVSGIYGIQNTLTGEWYVGQSQNIHKRKGTHFRHLEHGCHENEHLQRAFDKYGAENFSFTVLEECAIDSLNSCEVKWIVEKNAFSGGYNMTAGGDGVRGYCFSEEIREKMSQSQMGHTVSEMQRRKMSLAKSGNRHHQWGKPVSAETKAKISATLKVTNAHLRRPVVCVETGAVYESISAAAKAVGRNFSTLSEARKNGTTCGGYHWEFFKEVRAVG